SDAHGRRCERRAHSGPRRRRGGTGAGPPRGAGRSEGCGSVSELGDGRWQRLHPLSPLVSAGRVLIAIVILAAPSIAAGRGVWDSLVQLVLVLVLALLGVVTWLVTRWRVEDDDLRIETGLIRRSSLRFPLRQLQAIDIVRPGLARLFGLSEL